MNSLRAAGCSTWASRAVTVDADDGELVGAFYGSHNLLDRDFVQSAGIVSRATPVNVKRPTFRRAGPRFTSPGKCRAEQRRNGLQLLSCSDMPFAARQPRL
jgi:hypothetical protein